MCNYFHTILFPDIVSCTIGVKQNFNPICHKDIILDYCYSHSIIPPYHTLSIVLPYFIQPLYISPVSPISDVSRTFGVKSGSENSCSSLKCP